jgi:GntR family transcriptional regulator of gluconate operon
MIPRVKKVRHPKLFEVVTDQLRDSIMSGDLRPGDRLPLETELAEQFGVSRGPIREALRELEREGLLADLPRRGTIVSVPTVRELMEVYAVREAIELFAVTAAIERGSANEFADLGERNKALKRAWRNRTSDPFGRVETDMDFHREIFRLAGNSRMQALFEQFARQTALLLRTAVETDVPLPSLSPSDVVHEGILQAMLAGDQRTARAAVTEHYRHTREWLFASVTDQPASPGGGDEGTVVTATPV